MFKPQPCLYRLLFPDLVGKDVECFLQQLVEYCVESAELRVIRPVPGFDLRRTAGPGIDATHNDRDTQDPILFRDGDLLPEVDAEDVLCITSMVTLSDKSSRRLLLLDFRVPVSDEAQTELEEHLSKLGWRGVLVMTGSSYHFLGAEALNLDTWVDRMNRSLLIPGIDWRYIGHALIRQSGAARFTTCELKPTLPKIVALINSDLP